MSDADIGGDPPCWAHLFDDAERVDATDGSVDPLSDSLIDPAVKRATPNDVRTDRPSHPVVPALILMVGVVVFLILISLVAVL